MDLGGQATLDFVGDIICPWCWIARRRLDDAVTSLAAEGLRLGCIWRPFLLYPDMPPDGVPQAQHLATRFASTNAADRYHDGVAEAGRAVGIDFHYERIIRTPNSIDAHRLLLLAGPGGPQSVLADALAKAFFTDGSDIGDRATLIGLAAAVGMDPVMASESLASSVTCDDVRSSDQRAKKAGIKGVPAFCLHGRILSAADPADLAGAIRTAHRALSGLNPIA